MQIRMPIRLRKLSQSGKQRLFVVPYMFTFANACMGLLAVLYAWDDHYQAAAACIILAAICDALDGRLARVFNCCSHLGMELDSLCDAISFCFAPAIVVYGYFFANHNCLGMLAVGLFLCAGLFRLAKFNNTSGQQKHFFIGMSTPVAAVFLSLLIIHHARLACTRVSFIYQPYVLMGVVMLLAYFMVSRFRFPTFKGGVTYNMLTCIVAAAIALGVIFAFVIGYPMLLVGMSVYVMIVVALHLFMPKKILN